ncbi:MAG: VTT domain-containing protein [Fimbriimonadales bacterium]
MAVWDIIRHLDDHVANLIKDYGVWTYGILFGILFAETGFVITPFLPGDTLLFAAGIFSQPQTATLKGGGLNIWLTLFILTLAPLAGDNVNYFFGRWLGPKLFHNPKSRFFKKENLEKTHAFYEKYGANAVILARWIPVVRTFSPFVAGMGAMPYRKFLTFSIVGAFLWVWTLVLAGFFLSKNAWVRDNFEWVMILMIVVTGGPVLIEVLKRHYYAKRFSANPALSPDSPEPTTDAVKEGEPSSTASHPI